MMTLLLIAFMPIQAISQSNNLVLQLQQAVDTNCDHVNDTAYVNTALSVLPKQCIMFKIMAHNRSTKPLKQLTIKGKIPLYTRLQQNSLFVTINKQRAIASPIQQRTSTHITVKLVTLPPKSTASVVYSVLVD
jgi:hypothetical protein